MTCRQSAMTDQEFRDLWMEASSEVADRFYPKGETMRRDEYLRDQAVLYVEIVKRLSAYGYLENE